MIGDVHSVGGALTIEMIEQAVQASINNFRPHPLMMYGTPYNIRYPEFNGTEWAYKFKLTRREKAFAKIQSFLVKLDMQKHLQDGDERREDCLYAQKRLLRAKWARYTPRNRGL